MKIIFSPTKEMNTEKPEHLQWELNQNSKKIKKVYEQLSDKELCKNLKINDNILEQVKSYINGFSKNTTYKALYLYNGLSFRTLSPETLTQKAVKYLNKNMLILSAFYGPISPLANIKPYRLDFLSKIKIENKTLKSFWKNGFDQYVIENDIILNLASNEFSEIFNKKKYRWIDFEFLESKDDQLKKHSTISKKGRALLLRYLADNEIYDLEKLKNFNYENYKLSNSSTDTKFIFIKEV